jgi:hypothetical protein
MPDSLIPRSARQRLWTARRFGMSPSKLLARLANPGAPRVLCITVPKSGTHLLERVLCLHPRLYRRRVPTLTDTNVSDLGTLRTLVAQMRPGEILFGHLPHRPYWERAARDGGAAIVFLTRDPRDVAVSDIEYMSTRTDHPHHDLFARVADRGERLALLLDGVPGRLRPFHERLAPYAAWLTVPGVFALRFEDLVGKAGGGRREAQEAAIRGLFTHLGLPLHERKLAELREGAFSDSSPTFRQGRIGGWRDAFDATTAAHFDEAAGELVDMFGYSRV